MTKTDVIDFKPEKGDESKIQCWKCEEEHTQSCVVASNEEKGKLWAAFECSRTGCWNEVEVVGGVDS